MYNIYILYILSKKKLRWFQHVPPVIPTPCPFNILAQATGEVAVGHRRVEWRSEEFEVTAAADHRVQTQMHTVAAMALGGSSDGETGRRDGTSSRRVCSMESWRVVGVLNKTNN